VSADTVRLFFALWPPAGLAEQLAALARQIGGGRATRADTIHLTLAFLGAVPVDRLDALRAVAATIEAPAFELHIDRLGYWAHKHLLWAGCAPEPALAGLVDLLRCALQNAGFAEVDGKRQEFFPHVTLLRKLAEKAQPGDCPQLDRWPCQRFVLVRSRLSAAGSVYETIGEFPLHS